MAEFSSGEGKLVRENEPIVFENKTDSSFDVGMGVVFHKSGIYEISIVGNRTVVTKVTERKRGEWISIWDENDPYTSSQGMCSRCGRISSRPLGDFCKWCGVDMRGKQNG